MTEHPSLDVVAHAVADLSPDASDLDVARAAIHALGWPGDDSLPVFLRRWHVESLGRNGDSPLSVAARRGLAAAGAVQGDPEAKR